MIREVAEYELSPALGIEPLRAISTTLGHPVRDIPSGVPALPPEFAREERRHLLRFRANCRSKKGRRNRAVGSRDLQKLHRR
jgi:hypothetical protein